MGRWSEGLKQVDPKLRLWVKGGKTPYEKCSPHCPRQQTLAWVQAANTTRCAGGTALKFRESVQAWTLRSDPPDQPPQRHGTSSSRAVIYQTTRVAAFGLAAGFHIMSTAIVRPATCPFHLATGDPPLGLLSQADLTERKPPRPLHLSQTFQAIGNPETSAQSIVCRDMGIRREGLIQTAVMGSWIVEKGRSAEAGWLFAVEAG